MISTKEEVPRESWNFRTRVSNLVKLAMKKPRACMHASLTARDFAYSMHKMKPGVNAWFCENLGVIDDLCLNFFIFSKFFRR